MQNPKNLLIAAALTGAMAGLPLVAQGSTLQAVPRPSADRLGCAGKDGQKADKDKHSCQGKDQQPKKHDKAACSGKDGCGGKDKQK